MNAYAVGQSVRLSASFTNPDDTPYDPVTVTFIHKAPDAGQVSKVYGTDPGVQRDGLGLYHLDVVADTAGEWHYRIEGAGGGQAAAEGVFYVTPAEV